jgi:hypothetical protein
VVSAVAARLAQVLSQKLEDFVLQVNGSEGRRGDLNPSSYPSKTQALKGVRFRSEIK